MCCFLLKKKRFIAMNWFIILWGCLGNSETHEAGHQEGRWPPGMGLSCCLQVGWTHSSPGEPGYRSVASTWFNQAHSGSQDNLLHLKSTDIKTSTAFTKYLHRDTRISIQFIRQGLCRPRKSRDYHTSHF